MGRKQEKNMMVRANMVLGQLYTDDITQTPLLDAMEAVPRELFVPEAWQNLAYAEKDIPLETFPHGSKVTPVMEGAGHVGCPRHLLQPRTFAKMLAAVNVRFDDVVLDIACGTGYSTAVLSNLCEMVISLEERQDFVEMATKNMQYLKIDNCLIVERPVNQGYVEQSPFDVILLNGCVDTVPPQLLNQLDNHGRLVGVFHEDGVSRIMVFTRYGDSFSRRFVGEATAPPLWLSSKPATFSF